MDDMNQIKEDLKEIKADIKNLSKILDTNTASLIVHEARTTLAEKRIERFEGSIKWLLGLIFTSLMSVLIKLMLK